MINISIIGGDNRNVILAKMLKEDGFNVYSYGISNQNCSSLDECVEMSKYVVTAVPFTNDFENIHTNDENVKINIGNFINILKDKVIIGGKFLKSQIDDFEKNNNEVIDLMKNEELALNNVIPTVEGIIKIIIENTDETIDGSDIAILGYGRIGKRLSRILDNMGANIYCFDNKKEEVANINLCGYNVIENICTGKRYNVIVNTVPELLIGEKELKHIRQETLIIDVASKPGGVDYSYEEINKYKIIHALGIPGKVAPVTAARYIEEIIKKQIIEV